MVCDLLFCHFGYSVLSHLKVFSAGCKSGRSKPEMVFSGNRMQQKMLNQL